MGSDQATTAGRISLYRALFRGRCVFLLLFLLVYSGAPAAQMPASAPGLVEGRNAPGPLLVDEARRFMDEYAAELRRGDIPAITGRYDRNSVYEIRPAAKQLTTHADLVKRYRERWGKPAFFEWRNLSYEELAPDKVLVTGLFAWADSTSATPDVQSYVAILQRQDGELRIRLEAEAWRDGANSTTLAAVAVFFVLATLLASWLLRKLIARHRARNR
jgi:hypothetical protein